MVEVIPTILEKDIAGVAEKLARAETIFKRTQIDVIDGKFAPNKTYFTPQEVSRLNTNCELEMHLMVEKPVSEISCWCRVKKVKRVYFHLEATTKVNFLIRMIRDSNKEVGLAITPQTPPQELFQYLSLVDDVLFLGVHPGFSGQRFRQEVLLYVRTLRNAAPYLSISLDGGVDDSSAPLIARAGANRLITSSYLFSAKNISRAKRILEILCS